MSHKCALIPGIIDATSPRSGSRHRRIRRGLPVSGELFRSDLATAATSQGSARGALTHRRSGRGTAVPRDLPSPRLSMKCTAGHQGVSRRSPQPLGTRGTLMPTQPSPRTLIVLPLGKGRSYDVGRIRAVFEADGHETQAGYSISEWWLEPHTAGPGAPARLAAAVRRSRSSSESPAPCKRGICTTITWRRWWP